MMPEPAAAAPARPLEGVRRSIAALPASKIREVADAGIGRADLIPLWFGEPDVPTPAFICEAASRALAAGDTYYQPNAGIPELRATLADYMNRLYGTRLGPGNVIVAASAMNALMLVMQALVDPGDEVVTTTPAWPNLPAVPQILSGRIRSVPLQPRQRRLAPRSRPPVRRLRRAHPGDLPQLAQQPDRLDDGGRGAAGGARVRPRARHLDRQRRGLRPDRLRPAGGALVPRAGGAGRPPDRGQQLLQELGDDRLAAGLDHRSRPRSARPSRC